jgi:hypothetical protein
MVKTKRLSVFTTALAATAILGCGVAHADYTGPRTGGGATELLDIIHTHTTLGGGDGGDQAAVNVAKDVCADLESDSSRHSIQVFFTQKHGWADNDAEWMTTASAVAFCPSFIVDSDRW